MDFSLFIPNMVKIWDKYWEVFLLTGLKNTLLLTLISVAMGTLLGTLVAMAKMSKFKPLQWLTSLYVEIIRGTPILLQLYFFWIFLPKILPVEISDLNCILIALIINASAYISEIIRAGIGAVDKGQWEAAKSIGLSPIHTLTHVILPQAIKNILPALCNEFISTVKGTSLASVFFVGELMTQYKTVASITYLPLQPLVVAGIIYFVLNFILSRSVRVLERRLMVSD